MTNLEKYLYQLRRIEEHRSKAAEKEIRKIYKELLKELKAYLADVYFTYSVDDILEYGTLARVGMDARFLEEVEQRINDITPRVAKSINSTVTLAYDACYAGMQNAVLKAAGNREALKQALSTITAATPDVIAAAVNNPVSGLTLKDTLEKHRKDIIYDIKKNIGVGLSNGDRFSTMARRISECLDGDYKKSVRIVRTEAHRVREAGLNDAATDIDNTLRNGSSGYVMAKTWHTMEDSRVRPSKQKRAKYNHIKMEGVTIAQDELFEMPSGATCKCPGQTGVAGEDINCRCYVSYDLVKASELTKVQDGEKTIEEAAEAEEPTKQEEPTEPEQEQEPAKRKQIDAGHGIVQDEELEDFNNRAYESIKKETGYSDKEAKEFHQNMQYYFGGNYEAFTEGEAVKEIKIIDAGLARMKAYDGDIYRGMGFLDDYKDSYLQFKNIEVGSEISMRSLSSWTSDIEAAQAFGGKPEAYRDTVLLVCKNNKTSVGVQHISNYRDVEAEVLARSDTKWTVKSVETRNSYDAYEDYLANYTGKDKDYLREIFEDDADEFRSHSYTVIEVEEI